MYAAAFSLVPLFFSFSRLAPAGLGFFLPLCVGSRGAVLARQVLEAAHRARLEEVLGRLTLDSNKDWEAVLSRGERQRPQSWRDGGLLGGSGVGGPLPFA